MAPQHCGISLRFSLEPTTRQKEPGVGIWRSETFFSPKMPESSPGVSGYQRNAAAFWRVAKPTVVLACSRVDKPESV
jgi:hypothetical protein